MDDQFLAFISSGDIAGLIQCLHMENYSQRSLNRGLRMAAFYGQMDCIRILLRAGADINCVDEVDGSTLLLKAVHSDNFHFGVNQQRRPSLEVINMLLQQGAQVDGPCTDGSTALMAVCGMGWTEGAQVLLSHRARVSAVCDKGKTALILCPVT